MTRYEASNLVHKYSIDIMKDFHELSSSEVAGCLHAIKCRPIGFNNCPVMILDKASLKERI